MDGKAKFAVLVVAALLYLPTGNPTRGAETAAGRTYALVEVAVSDCPATIRSELERGQPLSECGSSPRDGVTYPTFKSNKPIYGAVPFGISVFDMQAGIRYEFALDASTGENYDRLYFDANHDRDLTNDPAVGLAAEGSASVVSMPEYVTFESIQVELDYGPGQGTFKQTVVPRMMPVGDTAQMLFAVPTARRGKIKLGDEEVELVLGQNFICGRYDDAMTGAFLVGRDDLLPTVGYWPNVDGTFYRICPTPAGDKVTVVPCNGPFGILATDTGTSGAEPPEIELGWLISKDSLIDVRHCRQSDGKLKVPAGEYRALRLMVKSGRRRLTMGIDTGQLGQVDAAPAVFPIVVRPNETCVLDFSERLDVVFESPPSTTHVRPGEDLTVTASLRDVRAGVMVAGIEDTANKEGSTNAYGQELDMYASVSPTVAITSSSGRVVAEGTMPFG